MDDGPAIGLGVLVLAVIAVLAGQTGSHPALLPSTGSGSGSTSTTRSAGTTSAGTTSLAAVTTTPRCTVVATVKSRTGTSYTQYPVSSSGSTRCYLARGDTGLPVAALQRGMALCMGHPLVADGVYGALTGNAVASVGRTGTVYGPVTAGRMRWPWFTTTTTKFNSRCTTT
jgi:hypothetical protein